MGVDDACEADELPGAICAEDEGKGGSADFFIVLAVELNHYIEDKCDTRGDVEKDVGAEISDETPDWAPAGVEDVVVDIESQGGKDEDVGGEYENGGI